MAAPPGPSTAPRDPDKLRAARTAGAWNFARRGPQYGPGGELPAELLELQGAKTPWILSPGGYPKAPPPTPPLMPGRVTVVTLSGDLAAAGTTNAIWGPITYPFIVQYIAVSTGVRRIAATSGLSIVARPDLTSGSTLVTLQERAVALFGGLSEQGGAQFYAPGPTGETAYASPNIIIPEVGWFLQARFVNDEAVQRSFGAVLQIAALSVSALANALVPAIFPIFIQQQSYQVAPLPAPTGPVQPKGVLVQSYGTNKVVSYDALAPELKALATDPLTGAWIGTKGLTAIW